MTSTMAKHTAALVLACHVLALPAASLAAGRARAGPAQPQTQTQHQTAERFEMRSARTGLDYRIFLVRPAAPPPPGGYPVIYLLDGNATVPMMETVLSAPDAEASGPAVVVGVGYPTDEPFDVVRRYYDLTPPTPADLVPPSRSAKGPITTGGRDAFLAFLEEEVKPAVESRLPIDRTRQTLMGHSLGGLFALHVLYTRGNLFQTYVAADPAIWWKNQAILEEQAAFIERVAAGGSAAGLSVLIETAGAQDERPRVSGPEMERVRRLRSGQTGREVAATLAGVPGLRVYFRTFPGKSHGPMLPLAVADTLPFALGHVPEGAAVPPNE